VRYLKRYIIHALIAGLAILLTLSVQMALSERYSLERRKIEQEASKRRSRDMAASWNRLRFCEAATGRLGHDFVAAVGWPRLALSEAQKARLKDRLQQVLNYLQDPSLEEYYSLKTEALVWNFELSPAGRLRLGNTEIMVDGVAQRQPLDVVFSLWEASCHESKTGQPPRLTAVCLESIDIARSDTNSAAALLKGPVAKGFTVAHEATDPGFIYGHQAAPGSAERVEDLFVFLGFLARSDASNDAGPVYISFYWSDQDQNWALSSLLTDALLNMNILF
jgi:hypothetical protein